MTMQTPSDAPRRKEKNQPTQLRELGRLINMNLSDEETSMEYREESHSESA